MIRKGTPIAHYIEQLEVLDMKGGNVLGSMDRVMDYVEWVHQVEGFLRALYISSEPADRLFSDRHWRIAEHSAAQFTHKLLSAEVKLQRDRLRQMIEELKELQAIGDRPGELVILDTNVLLHFQRIDMVRWPKVVGVSTPLRLVIPVLVLDEMDERRYTGSPNVKKAARTALKPLEERLADIERQGYSYISDNVTVEYLLAGGDKFPGNPDADILDQAELLQHAANRAVTVVTGDHGMRQRAVVRGLKVATMLPEFARDRDEAQGVMLDS
ncbi:PIN domain-containing protein [Streptomyces litmocidini]|uniref:PIN domain-containing protein n=1 Tax=Streptomyces litmocidini TaxID=67318 RepID=A0ABW7UD85_9ACTN